MSDRIADTTWHEATKGALIFGAFIVLMMIGIWGIPAWIPMDRSLEDEVYDQCMAHYVFSQDTHELCTKYAAFGH